MVSSFETFPLIARHIYMFFGNICGPKGSSLHFKLLPTYAVYFLYARST